MAIMHWEADWTQNTGAQVWVLLLFVDVTLHKSLFLFLLLLSFVKHCVLISGFFSGLLLSMTLWNQILQHCAVDWTWMLPLNLTVIRKQAFMDMVKIADILESATLCMYVHILFWKYGEIINVYCTNVSFWRIWILPRDLLKERG